MPITEQQVQVALDQRTSDTFISGPNPVPVLFGNQTNLSLSQGTTPYLKQKVVFQTDKQMQLGDPCFRRHNGYILFFIHYRKNTGDQVRNLLKGRIAKAFRTQVIGGATMKDVILVANLETENWAIVGVQIPFYFDAKED